MHSNQHCLLGNQGHRQTPPLLADPRYVSPTSTFPYNQPRCQLVVMPGVAEGKSPNRSISCPSSSAPRGEAAGHVEAAEVTQGAGFGITAPGEEALPASHGIDAGAGVVPPVAPASANQAAAARISLLQRMDMRLGAQDEAMAVLQKRDGEAWERMSLFDKWEAAGALLVTPLGKQIEADMYRKHGLPLPKRLQQL